MRREVGALLLLISVTACGTPSADGPKCSEVWVVGHTLPKNYEGCDPSAADAHTARVTTCGTASGGRFVEYGEFNAVAGHSVHQGNAKARLRTFLRACS